MKKFNEITICLDMYGCPNRCKHCWLGADKNGSMDPGELEHTAELFRPYAHSLRVYDWYREPDYSPAYKELFETCRRLSDGEITHFELISFWRLVRDGDYVKWLVSLGLERAQLTLFGGEETTDRYVGRKGAYREILEATEILLANGISPRIQVFVNKENLGEMPHIKTLIKDLDLEGRCRDFTFFLHGGSCDGENEKLYRQRLSPDDLDKLPDALVEYTLKHFRKSDIREVFGRTERDLYAEMLGDGSVCSYVSDTPVFYIDRNFDVYPNITAPEPHWRLGNIKTQEIDEILENYADSASPAQRTRLTVPLCEIVKSQGDGAGAGMFGREDYITFLLNKFCRRGGGAPAGGEAPRQVSPRS